MRPAPGSYTLGPDSGSLVVNTYREGVAAKAGHDLVIEVTRWEATVDVAAETTIELRADLRSLEVREGSLTDSDRAEIVKNIDAKVLCGQPIAPAPPLCGCSTAVWSSTVLTTSRNARPVTVRLDVDEASRVSGTIPLAQSDWGIRPYRRLMGALEVRDELEVVIDAQPRTAAEAAETG